MDILKHFGRIVLVDKEKAYTFKKLKGDENEPIKEEVEQAGRVKSNQRAKKG